MNIAEGTIIDTRFRIGKRLGKGAIGAVYEAQQLDLDRLVAIKFLSETAMSEAEDVARFHREAKILSTLKHKNIVAVYAFGKWEGAYYMVMERVGGTSFDSMLKPGEPLERSFILDFGMQVCNGLEAAHKHGIIHRDIKPSNLIVAESGDVKIIDFGFAKITGPTSAQFQQLTEAGTAIGTVLYMSPEQCKAKKVDARTDVYALGAVLYHAFAGKPPFTGTEYLVVMRQQIEESAPPISGIDRDTQNLIDNAMLKDPDARYQTIGAMKEDLENLLKKRPVTLQATNAPTKRHRKAQRPRAAVVAAISAGIIGALAVLFYFAHQTGAPHSVTAERADMIALLNDQIDSLAARAEKEKDHKREAEWRAELAETYLRLSAIDDRLTQKNMEFAGNAASEAIEITPLHSRIQMMQRLRNCFRYPGGEPRFYTVAGHFMHSTDLLREAKDYGLAHKLYSQALKLGENEPMSEAVRNYRTAALLGMLVCDRYLNDPEQSKEDVERCLGVVSKYDLSKVATLEHLDTLAEVMAQLGFVKEQVQVVAQVESALRSGRTYDDDYHHLSQAAVHCAAGFVRAKDYPRAYKIILMAQDWTKKSPNDDDRVLFKRVCKEWAFNI